MIRHINAALAFAAVLFAPIAASAGAPSSGFAALRERVLHPPPGYVVVVAHRACFAAAPENSPEAIETCARLGVEVVENDVRSTKDGELVVMHDDTVNRTTNGWGYLNDLTMADLAKLRLRDGEGGPAAAVTNIPVTTLRAYYRAAKGKVMINLELKPSLAANFEILLQKSLRIAAEEGVLGQILLKVPDQMSHGKLASKHILSTIAPPQWSGGLSDQVSMSDPEAGWGKLLGLGASVIMTDHPEYLLRYLEKTGRRGATSP